ncbi:MAG: ABC transporter substrate binding protein [Acidobacteriota bacterium]
MELWVGALNLGFLYAFMTMGIFITFRVYDFADITVDGSLTAGAAVSAMLIVAGWNPLAALAAAAVAGAAAGACTALIHTRLNVHGLLAGILVMTGLYSINLHVMGKSNIPLLNQTTFVTYLDRCNPGLPPEIWTLTALVPVMILFWLAVSVFFRTDAGITMRASGNNPPMAAAMGVNVDLMKTFAVAAANALAGLSGGLVAQYQGFADIGMGIGTVVIGLAAVIMGESVVRSRSLYAMVFGVILGSIVFRLMIAFALSAGMNPIDLKILTALFVLATLMLSQVFGKRKQNSTLPARLLPGRRTLYRLGGAAALLALIAFGYRQLATFPGKASEAKRIGVVQLVENPILNLTRDALLSELKGIGHEDGKDISIQIRNANGDISTLNTILDDFLRHKTDIVVTISTQATQSAINKVKDRPVVFATVANPFIIGAGSTETDHLANVTGVYGSVPMDKMVKAVQSLLPGHLSLGVVWDSGQANSVHNAENLKKAMDSVSGLTFVGTTISNSSEVYQAALSLVQKGVNAFVLPPDNTVFSAFESVVKAARTQNIPIFVSDVERLKDGALVGLGFDYASSGIQAAHLVERILKGEDPAKIPFERYRKLTLGLNADVASELGILIPAEVAARADEIHGDRTKLAGAKPLDSSRETGRKADQTPAVPVATASGGMKRIVLFRFSDNELAMECTQGFMEELEKDGAGRSLKVDTRSAENDQTLAQSIAQEIVAKKYDTIVTLSTLALQAMARTNRDTPHVFGMVTDPYRMGIAKSPVDHLPTITGVASLQPVEATIRAMKEVFPDAKRVGLVWNPSEASSETCTYKAREVARTLGLELVEATVTGTGEVMDAVNSLVSRGIDIFFTSGDNTVIVALPSIAAALKARKIPYFTNTPSDVERGALIGIGADYAEVGRETARMAKRVIAGEAPSSLPIEAFVPERISVNQALAEEYGITLPKSFLKRAAYIKE